MKVYRNSFHSQDHHFTSMFAERKWFFHFSRKNRFFPRDWWDRRVHLSCTFSPIFFISPRYQAPLRSSFSIDARHEMSDGLENMKLGAVTLVRLLGKKQKDEVKMGDCVVDSVNWPRKPCNTRLLNFLFYFPKTRVPINLNIGRNIFFISENNPKFRFMLIFLF